MSIVLSWNSQSQIRSIMNGKCLDIYHGINEAGTNVQMHDCNGEPAQNWYYDIATKEIKNINPVGVEYCLDLVNGNRNDGTNIVIWHCDGSNKQKWVFNDDNTISNINDGCLDIFSYNHDNYANVGIWTCYAQINQQWILTSEIKSIMHGKCLDVEDGNIPGTNVRMYQCNGKNAQQWYYNKLTKEIKNINPNGNDLCLDVVNGNTADGTNIVVWNCDDSNKQKWILNADETISNINGGCLDASLNQNDYANVYIHRCDTRYSALNHRWFATFIPMKSPKELIIRKTSSYDWAWDDSDTGATLTGTIWKPKLYSTEAFISFVNTFDHNKAPTEESMIIIRYPSDALANPIEYNKIWDDSGSGGEHDVSIWRPIAPPGYICYGDIVHRHISDKPLTADGYKCIHSRYVHLDSERIATSQELMWNDDESGADNDIQIVKIRTNHHLPRQYYRSHDQYNRYIDNVYGSIELTPISATELVQMKSVLNSLCVQGTGGDGHLMTVPCDPNINDIWFNRRQLWSYIPETREMKDGYGICLAINGDNVNDGGHPRIQVQRCNGNYNQKWLIDAWGAITNFNGKCMDVENHNLAAWTWIISYDCHHTINQLWIGGHSFGIQDIKDFAARRFAPILRFDRSVDDEGYPMHPDVFITKGCMVHWQRNICENKQLNVISNPTYYRILSGYDVHTGTFNIMYWWFYGDQKACNPSGIGDNGAHHGDWERIIVHIKHWLIESVTFYQHGGHYTVPSSDINADGDHVYVYVGKIAHGSYYDSRDDIGGGCGYFYDWRNPDHASIINTWNNLINLETSVHLWIVNKIDICCANPLTYTKNENDCDDIGCNWRDCNSDAELMFMPWQCVG